MSLPEPGRPSRADDEPPRSTKSLPRRRAAQRARSKCCSTPRSISSDGEGPFPANPPGRNPAAPRGRRHHQRAHLRAVLAAGPRAHLPALRRRPVRRPPRRAGEGLLLPPRLVLFEVLADVAGLLDAERQGQFHPLQEELRDLGAAGVVVVDARGLNPRRRSTGCRRGSGSRRPRPPPGSRTRPRRDRWSSGRPRRRRW